jgi:hypothetical protein
MLHRAARGDAGPRFTPSERRQPMTSLRAGHRIPSFIVLVVAAVAALVLAGVAGARTAWEADTARPRPRSTPQSSPSSSRATRCVLNGPSRISSGHSNFASPAKYQRTGSLGSSCRRNSDTARYDLLAAPQEWQQAGVFEALHERLLAQLRAAPARSRTRSHDTQTRASPRPCTRV